MIITIDQPLGDPYQSGVKDIPVVGAGMDYRDIFQLPIFPHKTALGRSAVVAIYYSIFITITAYLNESEVNAFEWFLPVPPNYNSDVLSSRKNVKQWEATCTRKWSKFSILQSHRIKKAQLPMTNVCICLLLLDNRIYDMVVVGFEVILRSNVAAKC